MSKLDPVISSKPFIIAEVGSNWLSLEDCLKSITEAKKCGANAVKFQMFDWKDLYGYQPTIEVEHPKFWGGTCKRIVDRKPMHGGIKKEWLEPLWEKCRAQGIEFMCTPFSMEGLEAIDPFVNYHKVASSDLEYKELFEALAKINKPVFFSTGGHREKDIERVLNVLGSCPSVIMYCVSAYPAHTTQLENITSLKNQFKNFVGFSDHTTDILELPKRSVDLGAIVIEKHFKLGEMNTPDNPHSLNPHDFSLMVKNIRNQHAVKLMTHEETDMELMYNRRLMAIKNINAGEILVNNYNYGAFRSLTPSTSGLSGWLAEDVNGKVCRSELKQGDHLGIESILL